MPKSKTITISPNTDAAEQWAVHVYGPILRRNADPEFQDEPLPIFAVHDPRSGFNEWFLCDIVTGGRFAARHTPEAPLPAGVGGSVIAAVYTPEPFKITTLDPWNWVDGGPPRILIKEGMTKLELYKATIRVYSKRGRG